MTTNWYYIKEKALSLFLKIIHLLNTWTLGSYMVALQQGTIVFIFKSNKEGDYPVLCSHFSFIITAGHLFMYLIRNDSL